MAHSGATDRIPVSAVLITKDADRHLDRVLQPLAVCAEIVVLDSGSTDRTRDIAEAHGAVWHEHPFDGFGPQKRRAVMSANHDWIVAVDADEVLDGEAAGHLSSIRWAEQDPATCWRIRRRPFIGDREIRHGHWVPDHVVRIFNRTRNEFSAVPLHESVHPTGPVLNLPGSLLHHSYADLAELFRADYFRLKAEVLRARGRRAGGGEIALRAMAAFLKSYLLRRGFLDGGAGVAVALAGAAHASVGLALASEDGVGDPRHLDDPAGRP
jgi:glycosyltransferase involved in cell wall biosynthesis